MPQVLRKHNCYRTLQRVSLTTQNTHMHIKLIPASYTGFPYSNLGSQSWFPSCSVAWELQTLLWDLGWSTVPAALWSFLPQGQIKPFNLRELTTSLSLICQLENRHTERVRICLIITENFRVTFRPQLSRCIRRNASSTSLSSHPVWVQKRFWSHGILSWSACCSSQVWLVVSSNPTWCYASCLCCP